MIDVGHPRMNSHDLEAADAVAERTIQASRSRAGLLIPAIGHIGNSENAHQEREPPSRDANGADASPHLGDQLGPPLVRIQNLETLIRDQPGNVDLYLELAHLYLARGRDYEAQRLLARGREATDRDPRIEQFAEDVTMLRLEKKLAAAHKEVDTDDTPGTREALQHLVRERDRVEIEIF